MIKSYTVSPGLRTFVEKELSRRGIPYSYDTAGKIIPRNISGNLFHMIVETAKADMLTEQSGLLHVSRHQLEKKGELHRLFRKHHTRGFVVCS